MKDDTNQLVSVIISVYNGEMHLAETVKSVISQSYRRIEIIIIDDGSTDGSGKVAQGFIPSVRYHYQPNDGIAAAWNRGIELATGDFFAFNGADDLWTENKIERQMEVFRTHSALDIVFGHVKQFHSPELSDEEKQKIWCPDELMPGVSAGTMLIKRESFFSVGLFNMVWRRGIFNDWYLRATERGLRVHMMPDLLMLRRLHQNNHGTINRDKSVDYVRMLKASLDRRRLQSADEV
ncbi:MAG TPA: glycosyltransferase family A protein [Thermodesulfovibrionales bacterium]|nr:glycosyltransferase family A protein [Thermodesulfovibrionales bacterium]